MHCESVRFGTKSERKKEAFLLNTVLVNIRMEKYSVVYI